jgi:hypothetical protein
MSHISNLNCFVLGDDPSRIFSVKILTTESVGALRDLIKDKNQHAFEHVDADALTLYTPKTSISTASKSEFNDALEKLNLGSPDERDLALDELNPTRKIEKYDKLSDPAEEVIHIIVFPPVGKYQCPSFSCVELIVPICSSSLLPFNLCGSAVPSAHPTLLPLTVLFSLPISPHVFLT